MDLQSIPVVRHPYWRRLALAVMGLIVLVSLGVSTVYFTSLSRQAHANPVTGAVFTTVNETVDGTGHCKNGNPNNNCNIYDGKNYVWLSGGPANAGLADGTYFFAVLVPGGQNDPNDGTAKNLSSPNDAYTNRTFSISNGTISYSGTHTFANNKIRLMPYDDTTNPGGVYIMAVCSLAGITPTAVNPPGVNPSDCKYDAFKIKSSVETTALTISKDATGAYTKTYGWSITKNVDKTTVTAANGNATFNYTVTLTKDSGTISGVTVTGTITVFNQATDSDGNLLTISGVNVTDALSNGTSCVVSNGTNQTITDFLTLGYTCNLASLPATPITNTATVTWPKQNYPKGVKVDAGTASFTTGNISFTSTVVHDCVTLSDSNPNLPSGALPSGNICQSGTYTYSITVPIPATAGDCTTVDNTATFRATDDRTYTGSASKEVKACNSTTPQADQLTASKTASGTDTRTYTWDIQKDVDKTSATQAGGSVTFNYTVTLTKDGGTLSNGQVTGTITINNPNAGSVTNVTISDTLSDGTPCSVTNASGPQTLTSGANLFNYTCTVNHPSSGTQTNVVTVSWPDQTVDGKSLSANTIQASHDFTFTESAVHGCVTLTDSNPYLPGGALPGGSICQSGTYHYSTSVPVQANKCILVDNTATFTATDDKAYTGSASKEVQVCDVDKLTLTITPDPAACGAPVTFKAIVQTPGAIPTGTVNFYDGNTLLGSGTISNGVAIYTASTFSTGTHHIHVVYASGNITALVGTSSTTITLTIGTCPGLDGLGAPPSAPQGPTSPNSGTISSGNSANPANGSPQSNMGNNPSSDGQHVGSLPLLPLALFTLLLFLMGGLGAWYFQRKRTV